MVGSARPVLKRLIEHGPDALRAMLDTWNRHLRGALFLTGSRTIADLRNARVVRT